MSDLDPDRFTLRQADAVREAYAQVMEELDLIKEQLARLPTQRDRRLADCLLERDGFDPPVPRETAKV